MTIKKLVTLLSACFITLNLYAQTPDQIKFPRIKSSSLLLNQDSSKISLEVAEKVVSRLEMQEVHRHNFAREYRRKTGLGGQYATAFVAMPVMVKRRSYIELQEKQVELDPYEQYYIYGFSSRLGEGKKVDENLSKILLSAYKQETDSAYVKNEVNFTTLRRVDRAEFRKRNWINMGYGLSYVAKDNPLVGSKRAVIVFGYFVEAVHYIPILAGPFFGETRQDKIGIPITGLAGLVIWKGLLMPLLVNSNIRLNNSIVNSGYKVPANLKY